MFLDEWKKSALGEIAKIQVGRDVQDAHFSECRTGEHIHPVYSNTVDQQGLYGFYDFEEYPGGAVTVVGRGIGLGTAFYKDRPFGAIGRLLVLHPQDGSFCPRFLADYINHRLRIFGESGGIPQLPGSSLARYSVTLPPLPEQRKIAEILSTWDRAIEVAEAQLANARKQKRALMQSLLTGKRRFPEFEGQPWREVRLDKLAAIKKGKQKSKSTLAEKGEFPVINGGIDPSGYTDEWNAEAGTITISEGGNSCGFVNLITHRFWSGGHCYTLENLKVHRDFLFHALKFREAKIMSLRVGSGLPNIQKKAVSGVQVGLPSDAEQRRIADTLNASRDDERNFGSQIEKLRSEKKALMQQLLTGKRRVTV